MVLIDGDLFIPDHSSKQGGPHAYPVIFRGMLWLHCF